MTNCFPCHKVCETYNGPTVTDCIKSSEGFKTYSGNSEGKILCLSCEANKGYVTASDGSCKGNFPFKY